jgi:prepilin-type N-terminal cleavage/methylation domain-containing protein/prepilin-type processing-associated H-X9-DG protein
MKPARGFTLTEMLVVFAIAAVLAGVGYPLTRSFVAKSREATCVGNLRTLGVALQGYLQDHNDKMPNLVMGRSSKNEDVPVMDTVLLAYTGSPESFHCPEDKVEFKTTGSSYSWNHLQSNLHVSNLYFFGVREDTIPLISDKASWHPSGTNFLFADFSSSNKPRFVTGN